VVTPPKFESDIYRVRV